MLAAICDLLKRIIDSPIETLQSKGRVCSSKSDKSARTYTLEKGILWGILAFRCKLIEKSSSKSTFLDCGRQDDGFPVPNLGLSSELLKARARTLRS